MVPSRRSRVLALLAVMTLASAACGDSESGSGQERDAQDGTAAPSEPTSGGVVTMGVYIETRGLDPVVAQGGGTGGGHEMAAIYGTLMRTNSETGSVEPYMAESLEANDDATEFTLRLRPDVEFTDGSAYDAEAVVRSLQRHTEHGSMTAGEIAIISEYTVVDPLTVAFELRSPWPNFGVLLAGTAGMITSKQAVESACDASAPARECSFNAEPVGAGPFMLDSYVPKDSITLERNPTYWEGPVALDALKFVTLPGAQVTYESVKSGQLQVGFLREAPAIVAAEADDSVETITNALGAGGVVLMNNGRITCRGGTGASVCEGKPDGVVDLDKPTGDVRIRQAIAAALDVDVMNERRNDGAGFASSAFFASGPLAGEPTAEHDPARAEALVQEYKDETGWDGSISVMCLDSGAGRAFGQAMEAMLNGVGFRTTVEIKPATEYVQGVQLTRDYDIACWGFNIPQEAPEAGLDRHVLSIAGGNTAGNAMNLDNAEIDAVLADVREAVDHDDKKAALDELTEVWAREMPSAIYETTRETIVSSPSVHGLELSVMTTVLFDKAWLD